MVNNGLEGLPQLILSPRRVKPLPGQLQGTIRSHMATGLMGPLEGVVCCVVAGRVGVCCVALCCVVWWWCVAPLMVGRAALCLATCMVGHAALGCGVLCCVKLCVVVVRGPRHGGSWCGGV